MKKTENQLDIEIEALKQENERLKEGLSNLIRFDTHGDCKGLHIKHHDKGYYVRWSDIEKLIK